METAFIVTDAGPGANTVLIVAAASYVWNYPITDNIDITWHHRHSEQNIKCRLLVHVTASSPVSFRAQRSGEEGPRCASPCSRSPLPQSELHLSAVSQLVPGEEGRVPLQPDTGEVSGECGATRGIARNRSVFVRRRCLRLVTAEISDASTERAPLPDALPETGTVSFSGAGVLVR